MTPARMDTLKSRARASQTNLCVVLDNVRDKHNVGAVMRSCDAVGVRDVHLIRTLRALKKETEVHGFKSASASQHWIRLHIWGSYEECFVRLRQMYPHIYATHLGIEARSLYDLDLCQPTALVFGNEQRGVSEKALAYCTGNFTIPMHGFIQSLNISVACAVSLYEAQRQRWMAGNYSDKPVASPADQAALLQLWTLPKVKKQPKEAKIWPVVIKKHAQKS